MFMLIIKVERKRIYSNFNRSRDITQMFFNNARCQDLKLFAFRLPQLPKFASRQIIIQQRN